MRRLFGCFSALLLVALLLLTLAVRGPGLGNLPDVGGLDPYVDSLARQLGISGGAVAPSPLPAQTMPVVQQPTASPPIPTQTAIPPTPSPDSDEILLTIEVKELTGNATNPVIDGNGITLAAQVVNATQASIAGPVYFSLEPLGAGGVLIAQCDVEIGPGGETECTVGTTTDGWAWRDHARIERRTIYASLIGYDASTILEVAVSPKPMVLVHGFTSNAATWSAWTGPEGFLSAWDVPGYAVGDGQFDIEPMNTGDFSRPREPTNSIAQNAEIVSRYVEAIRQATGAERIDLVAHSMGGLISRYYVSHFMPLVEHQGLPTRPAVNQLYMIGTPNGGTSCAIPPAAIGLYPPATTQLTPAYVQQLFNADTADSKGVPFFVLAGDPVQDYAALVCTPVPTDVFVSVASAAGAIPVTVQKMPVRHGEQTESLAVFAKILESLSRDPSAYPIPVPKAPAVAPEDTGLQVSVIDSGTLAKDGSTTVSVSVDEAETVSFQLYAPGQDIEMSIVNTAGQRITTESAKDVDGVSSAITEDHETTATQGFEIDKPQPGKWDLVLKPRPGTQTDESLYAVAVFLQSDLQLTVETPAPVVPAGKHVPIRAILTGPVALKTVAVAATVKDARGEISGEVTLSDDGLHDDGEAGDGVFGGEWTSTAPGLYGVSVTAAGESADGSDFQRLGVLAIEVR